MNYWLILLVLSVLSAVAPAPAAAQSGNSPDSNIIHYRILEQDEEPGQGSIRAVRGEKLGIVIKTLSGETLRPGNPLTPLTFFVEPVTTPGLNEIAVSPLPSVDWSSVHQRGYGTLDIVIPKIFNNFPAANTNKCGVFKVRFEYDAKTAHDTLEKKSTERRVTICEQRAITPPATPVPTSVYSGNPTAESEELNKEDSGFSFFDFISRLKGINWDYGQQAYCRTGTYRMINMALGAVPTIYLLPLVLPAFGFLTNLLALRRKKDRHWVRVVDSVTGKGVGNAIIEVKTPDGKVRSTWKTDNYTGNAGDLLPPGVYEFMVTKDGWQFPSQQAPSFPIRENEFVYRSGNVDISKLNHNKNA